MFSESSESGGEGKTEQTKVGANAVFFLFFDDDLQSVRFHKSQIRKLMKGGKYARSIIENHIFKYVILECIWP